MSEVARMLLPAIPNGRFCEDGRGFSLALSFVWEAHSIKPSRLVIFDSQQPRVYTGIHLFFVVFNLQSIV